MSQEVLINSTYSRPTWYCHWFPTAPKNQSDLRNTYAPGGPLQKYDAAFPGSFSYQYELRYNRTHPRSRHANWTGHCAESARVVSLLPEPTRDVTYNNVTFTPMDIQGLLVKVVNSLPFQLRDFCGRRYPEGHPQEPLPRTLIPKLRAWSQLHTPIILDINPYHEVWNTPFDMIYVDWTNQCLVLRSTGFPNFNRNVYFNWARNVWTSTHYRNGQNPDFAWVLSPTADLLRASSWPVQNKRDMNSVFYNPHVSPARVFEIYSRSI